jgi:hypothetical protein
MPKKFRVQKVEGCTFLFPKFHDNSSNPGKVESISNGKRSAQITETVGKMSVFRLLVCQKQVYAAVRRVELRRKPHLKQLRTNSSLAPLAFLRYL